MTNPLSVIKKPALQQFIERERGKLKTAYLDRPQTLGGDFNRENENIGGYRGRQLLEMLQNADDAAEGCEKQEDMRVLIRLTSTHLVIANNGTPFPKEDWNLYFIPTTAPSLTKRT